MATLPQAAARRRPTADQSAAPNTARPAAGKSKRKSPIRPVFGEDADQRTGANNLRQSAAAPDPSDDVRPEERTVPIDLSSALRLAGVENLELVQARQRVEFAVAVQQLAAAQILPTLNLGMNYDEHTGNLQQSSGHILNVQRMLALYVGRRRRCRGVGNSCDPRLAMESERLREHF